MTTIALIFSFVAFVALLGIITLFMFKISAV